MKTFAKSFAALTLGLCASAAFAQDDVEPNADCTITIDGTELANGACFVDDSDPDSIIVTDTPDNSNGGFRSGQFFYLNANGDKYDVYYGEDGSSHAHTAYGQFEATESGEGYECYAGDRGEICITFVAE